MDACTLGAFMRDWASLRKAIRRNLYKMASRVFFLWALKDSLAASNQDISWLFFGLGIPGPLPKASNSAE